MDGSCRRLSSRNSASAQSFIHHEAAGDRELAQRARNECLRLLSDIAPRRQFEIPELAAIAFERRQQSGQAERWEHLAADAISDHFAACNTVDTKDVTRSHDMGWTAVAAA